MVETSIWDVLDLRGDLHSPCPAQVRMGAVTPYRTSCHRRDRAGAQASGPHAWQSHPHWWEPRGLTQQVTG